MAEVVAPSVVVEVSGYYTVLTAINGGDDVRYARVLAGQGILAITSSGVTSTATVSCRERLITGATLRLTLLSASSACADCGKAGNTIAPRIRSVRRLAPPTSKCVPPPYFDVTA